MSCCDCFKSSKKKKNDSDFDPVIIEQTHLNLNGVSVEVLSMGADDVLKKQQIDSFIMGCTNKYTIPITRRIRYLKPFFDTQKHSQNINEMINIRYGDSKTLQASALTQNAPNLLSLSCMSLPVWRDHGTDTQCLERGFENYLQNLRDQNPKSLLIDDFPVEYFGYPRQTYIKTLLQFIQKAQKVLHLNYSKSLPSLQIINICSEDHFFLESLLKNLQTLLSIKIKIYKNDIMRLDTQTKDAQEQPDMFEDFEPPKSGDKLHHKD